MLLEKEKSLLRRRERIRKKIFGTADKPRLSFCKTNKYIYAQFIDDLNNKTILSLSSKVLKLKNMSSKKAATILGEEVGKKAVAAGIKQVVFDRGGNLYHGKVRAFADAVRASGVKF